MELSGCGSTSPAPGIGSFRFLLSVYVMRRGVVARRGRGRGGEGERLPLDEGRPGRGPFGMCMRLAGCVVIDVDGKQVVMLPSDSSP